VFSKLSLRVKLVGAFLVTASLVVVMSYLNLQTIDVVHRSFSEIVHEHMPRISTLQDMRALAVKLDKETAVYRSGQADAVSTETQKNQLLADLEKMTDLENDYVELSKTVQPGDKKEDTTGVLAAITRTKQETVNAVFELVSMKEQRAPANLIVEKENELANAEAALENAISVGVEQEMNTTDTASQLADKQAHDQRTRTLWVSVLAGMFAVFIGLLFSLSIAHRVKRLREGAIRVAQRDFSRQIDIQSKDELGQLAMAFNQMSASLQDSYGRLAFENERDTTLLESMNEGMIALDEHGRIVLINAAAARILELHDRQMAIGKDFSVVASLQEQGGTALAPVQLPSAITLKTGKQTSAVVLYASKEGKKEQIFLGASPFRLNGKIAGVIMLLRNVTKEKEVDRMKTEFISLASHQLRTPLSAIKWFSEMLLAGDAGKLNAEQTEFAQNITGSTTRMVELINSLLNISRMESGRIMIDPKPTDLTELVQGIINDLTAKIKEREQNVVVSVHPDLPKINLDPRLISQVYLNLLTNAIKYTPKNGDISVFVSKKDDMIVSQVTDNGYGIPQAEQARMFQKFFRAQNITKVETDGTGLGLYLVKSIVESSGGKIWFESEEAKGTTFWFTIPLSGMQAKKGEVTLEQTSTKV